MAQFILETELKMKKTLTATKTRETTDINVLESEDDVVGE